MTLLQLKVEDLYKRQRRYLSELGVIMKRIILKQDNPRREYQDDIDRITNAMAKAGFYCNDTEAIKLWEEYSDSLDADWLGLPKLDAHVVSRIRPFFEPVDDGLSD